MIVFNVEGIEYRVFNHIYAASRCGKVLRRMAPCVPTELGNGYLRLSKFLVHRIVATCWIENPNNCKHVHHKNGDKRNNKADNLEWVTPKEHFTDRHKDTHGKHVCSEETKEKIRQLRLGSVTSEETKAKQRAALIGKKRPFFHRKGHTQEWKDNMSLNHHKNVSCRVFGIDYRSFSEAAKATGIQRFTLRKRCLSKNFPEYEIVIPPKC